MFLKKLIWFSLCLLLFLTYSGSSFAVQYHITDHLGSVRAVLNQSMTILEQNDYYPFGLRRSISSSTTNRYHYNGEEEIAADATSDYGARQYSAEFCQWLQVDPLAEKYYSWSPYNFCVGNPLKYVDMDGNNPIYDVNGNLIGTDDGGLQGDAIVMNVELFVQGMAHDNAMRYNLGLDNFTDDEAKSAFEESFSGLKDRPDWDGVVTDQEARAWWNNGSGKDLYIDVSKIDLSPLEKSDFSEKDDNRLQFNFFLSPGASKTTGRVHGTLTMKLKNRETGEIGFYLDKNGYLDTYDFNGDGRIVRDATTWMARQIVGEGKGYGFKPYGKNPILKK